MPAKNGSPGKAAAAPVETETRNSVAMLTVHKSLYPADVLFGTAFGFLDRCFIHLDVADKDRIRVELTPRPGHSAEALAGEFVNEMVNQAVRLRLAKQTEKVRTMVVGRALGEAVPYDSQGAGPGTAASLFPDLPPEVAKILAEEEESLDFLDDPLGIAVPWEEKHAKGDATAPAKDDKPGA